MNGYHFYPGPEYFISSMGSEIIVFINLFSCFLSFSSVTGRKMSFCLLLHPWSLTVPDTGERTDK